MSNPGLLMSNPGLLMSNHVTPRDARRGTLEAAPMAWHWPPLLEGKSSSRSGSGDRPSHEFPFFRIVAKLIVLFAKVLCDASFLSPQPQV